MKYTEEDRTLALAGIFQAAQLVKKIAREGSCSNAALESCLETLFKFDANNVKDIYGGIAELSIGLNTLCQQLTGGIDKQDMEITRYVISLFHLEKKLSKNRAMLTQLQQGLEKTHQQMNYFDLGHENIIASLADIYQQTLSTISPKIIIQGEQVYLSQQGNANKIRALLLAAIRSTVLWRQCGGNRLQFIFSRNRYLKTAKSLLKTI
ncbi:MAG: high frequency lysogenization protein HflD [Gammaproteobacteria bacterium]|nr:high frequency lysogenization protein HflD [Gammaproteobacteria bacterium]